ncbi:MAG: hypothetical protein M3178_05765 [Pseudomonadota bacterium]|nr:hypothetical protein [Pseudomonadota bacterium]
MREARLLVSRPEEVFKELRSYGAQAKANLYGSDEQLEKSLLERGEPLIDLGLARYGSDKGMVGELYKKALITPNTPADARYRKGLRIACLSNQVNPGLTRFPREVIGEDETRRVLNEADLDEAETLLCNPEIECELLQALYERTGPFSTIPEDRWLTLVHMSAKNTRLSDCRDDEAGHDWGFMPVQKAILKLLEIAPVTHIWLFELYKLLDGLDPQHVAQPDKIDHVLERWSVDYKVEPGEGSFTSLGMKDEFRCLIAALYGKTFANNKTVVLGTATAPDVALRCAFYGNAELTPKEMRKGRNRDWAAFQFAVLFNDHIYLKPKLRKLLEEEYLTGNGRARYLRRCEQLHKRRRNFDPRPMAGWLALEGATETEQSTLSKLTAWASAHDTKMADLAKHIQTAMTWMAWGFIILAALVLLRK